MSSKRYDFFISYAHEDIERVRELDKALRALLRRPLRRAGFQVFRDETALAADPDLTSRLRAALDQSSWLLVVLTPASSKSPWVDREIEYWCEELGRAERLLIVRVAPSVDLEWDEAAGRFRSPSSLPPALVRAASAQPLYVELSRGPVEEAAVRVAAAVLGRSPEDIAGEDLRLHRRRKRLATAAIVGLLVLTLASVVASILAIRSSAAASRNEQRAISGEREAREQARQAVADALAARALVEAEDRPDKAFALALASARLDPSGSGEAVLLRLVSQAGATDRYFRVEGEPTAVALDRDGDSYAIGDFHGLIWVGKMGSAPGDPAADLESAVLGLGFAEDDRIVAGLADGRIVELAIGPDGSLGERGSVSVPGVEAWAFDSLWGRAAVLGSESSVLTLLDTRPGVRPRASLTQFESIPHAIAFDAKGSRLGVAGLWAAELLDFASGMAKYAAFNIDVEVESVALKGDGKLVAGGTPPGSNVSDGLLAVYGPNGERRGSTVFAQSVRSLAVCGNRVFFGTRAGEYGWLGSPVSATRTIRDLVEGIRSVACTRGGGFVVVGQRGFVHMRTHDSTDASNAFQVYSNDETGAPGELVRAGLAPDLGGIRTADDRRLRFGQTGKDLDELLSGEPPLESNCASLIPVELGSVSSEDLEENGEPHVLGRCGEMEVRGRGKAAAQLEIRVGGSESLLFGSGGLIPYSFAWSADGRRAFVGGSLEGMLYAVSGEAPPQEILRLTTPAFFSAASFAADGHVLITSVHYPPAYSWDATLYVIGGPPLERLACRLASGSLDDTVGPELLTGYDADDLGCDAVARESHRSNATSG